MRRVWICVYMHLVKSLHDAINLIHEDLNWVQPLDYEHVSFRFHKFHEHTTCFVIVQRKT